MIEHDSFISIIEFLKTYISISINNGSIVLTMYKLESHSTTQSN